MLPRRGRVRPGADGQRKPQTVALASVRALAFDTYGTVVDWRTSVLAELEGLADRQTLTFDCVRFLDDWKAAYRPAMDRVNRGEIPWTTVDAIYRTRLEELLVAYGIPGLTREEIDALSRVWWRLRPWPDAVAGIRRLKRRYIVTPLSNASFIGMVELARFAGLPWDCIITAENALCYKPRPEVYRTAVSLLGLVPAEVMMVAAHNYDLAAARAQGMTTAFVPRPLEYGPGQTTNLEAESDWDVIAEDLEDLATRLRCQ
ncbi:MAG: haloacid dehalogenase type II [Candidatus Rokuibacteriota bacterium]|nr:MAG: haloacid dehalogenase type II [Candidatus Rokubacteria bacterium]